jgi:thiamine-phosphate pyrophosphorylase
MFVLPPGLYGIVEPALGDPVEQARLLAEEGAAAVQLRCKTFSSEQLAAVAAACRGLSIPVIVNDDVHIAGLFNLPVHIGQDDGPDPDIPFGRSTHTVEQAARPGGAAYIGFGPVFGTVSKDSPWSARGVGLLGEAVRASPVPVVAIGGITEENLPAVRATGVHGWAVIGAVWRAPDPRARIRALRG